MKYLLLLLSSFLFHKSAIQSPVRGLILPHHDLAREIIIESLDKLKSENSKYSFIVVFSPNHFRPKSSLFTSTLHLKDFPIATDMVSDNRFLLDEQLLNNEHGLFIPIEYLHHYFPKAKFIPIAFSPYFTPEKLTDLASYLVTKLPNDTLYVASSDFSHENQAGSAIEKNDESISAIKNFDYRTFYEFKDDHLDARSAVGTLMLIMQNLGSTHWETWESTHGAIITSDPTLQGTSYVIGAFR